MLLHETVVGIGPDRVYPLHFTLPKLLQLLLQLMGGLDGICFFLFFGGGGRSFEMIKFQPLITIVLPESLQMTDTASREKSSAD